MKSQETIIAYYKFVEYLIFDHDQFVYSSLDPFCENCKR